MEIGIVMKLSKKLLSLALTIVLAASINWGYVGGLWSLICSSALQLVNGQDVSSIALRHELETIALKKFFKIDLDNLDDVVVDVLNDFIDGAGETTEEDDTSEEVVVYPFDIKNIPNMTRQEILDSIPDDWVFTEHNDFVHVRDVAGKIRIRIDPPDKITQYPHVHVYDDEGNLLDIFGNIVDKKSPDGHIPYKY